MIKEDTRYSNRVLAMKNTTKWKAVNDPNKPKKPVSPFVEFMEEFKKRFQEENPRNKSMADEKAPYVAKADKLKVEYEKNMTAYNRNQAHMKKGSRPLDIFSRCSGLGEGTGLEDVLKDHDVARVESSANEAYISFVTF